MNKVCVCRLAAILLGSLSLFVQGFPAQLLSVAHAQDLSASETSSIDLRESELRRKEQEILKSLNLDHAQAAAPLNAPPQESTLSGQRDMLIDAGVSEAMPVTVLDIQAPEEALIVEERPNGDGPQRLLELQHHPALNPRPTPKPYLPPSNNTIRTKSYEDFPDGTTAKRVGSFYRIGSSPSASASKPPVGSGRTVPLNELSGQATVRPALFNSDRIAVIRNTSTVLRTGPSRFDSVLVKIPQYSEVTIDYRSGGWYRIQTDEGIRGWLPGNSLLFQNGVSPRSVVHIGGVSDDKN